MKRQRYAAIFMFLPAASCTSFGPNSFPHQLLTADGQAIYLDEVQTIVDDPDLSDDEKRQSLRDLGIEDEMLINSLLEL